MKRLMLLFCALSSLAGAADLPASFAWRASLATDASAPYQRVTLPLAVYLNAAQPDLRDLRVFNAEGTPVPIARTLQRGSSESTTHNRALNWFPLTAPKAQASGDAGEVALSVRVRQSAAGALVEVQSGKKTVSPVDGIRRGYVLDASHLEKRDNVKALTLDWRGVTGFQLVDIAASDNLQDWRSVRRDAQLARLDYNGQRIERRRIELNGLPGRYLRLVWRDPVMAPELISAEIEETIAYWRSPPTEWSEPLLPVQSALKLQEGEFHYRLPQALPVSRIRLLLPPGNVLQPLEILRPDRERRNWRSVARTVAYRITGSGREWLHDEIMLPGWSLQEFILRIDRRSSQTAAPQLQVGIEPEQLVFLAEGKAPYQLAVGNAKAASVTLPLVTLVPGLGSNNGPQIADAKLLSAAMPAASASQPGALQRASGEIDWKKAALWGVLVAGVLAMGVMAWKLVRQLNQKK